MRVRVIVKYEGEDIEARFVQFTHVSVTLSCGLGKAHYCEAREGIESPSNAEMAVWREGQSLEQIGDDTVAGWADLALLPELLVLLMEEGAEKKIAKVLAERVRA